MDVDDQAEIILKKNLFRM